MGVLSQKWGELSSRPARRSCSFTLIDGTCRAPANASPIYSASSLLQKNQPVAKKKKAKTTARRKTMRRKMITGRKESMGSSFNRRPSAPISGNDEEEQEQEEEEEDEDEGEEKDEDEEQDDEEEDEEEEEEEDEGRKGWSD
jgi:TATA-binding protein-associated factor Taf7